MGNEDPGDGTGDGCFEVLCEPSASAEPSEGSFDDPTARQYLEALCRIGAFDDLECPTSEFGQRAAQLVAGVSAVGKDMAQPWVEALDRSQQPDRAIPILNVGRMHLKANEMSFSIGYDVP